MAVISFKHEAIKRCYRINYVVTKPNGWHVTLEDYNRGLCFHGNATLFAGMIMSTDTRKQILRETAPDKPFLSSTNDQQYEQSFLFCDESQSIHTPEDGMLRMKGMLHAFTTNEGED